MSETEEDAQFYRDTESVAVRNIDDTQLALLEPLGERRTLRHGEIVYRAGERDLPLTVVLRGDVEVYEDREGTVPGGQAGSSSLIENFFGFPTGISGGDLTYRAQLQAYRSARNFPLPPRRSPCVSMRAPNTPTVYWKPRTASNSRATASTTWRRHSRASSVAARP